MTQISTYQSWAKANGMKTRTFDHQDAEGHNWYRITDRPSLLRDSGFRLISAGQMEACSRRTDISGYTLTPRKAVERFLEDHYSDDEFIQVVYFDDPNNALELYVWGRRELAMALRDFSDEAMRRFDRKLRESNNMATVVCPECDADVDVSAEASEGDIIDCGDCGIEMEITALNPIAVELLEEEYDEDEDEDEY